MAVQRSHGPTTWPSAMPCCEQRAELRFRDPCLEPCRVITMCFPGSMFALQGICKHGWSRTFSSVQAHAASHRRSRSTRWTCQLGSWLRHIVAGSSWGSRRRLARRGKHRARDVNKLHNKTACFGTASCAPKNKKSRSHLIMR